MRQQLKFDLHFTDTKLFWYTGAGFVFYRDLDATVPEPTSDVYAAALEAGLTVSFETAAVRDKLTSIQIKETT